MAVPVQVWNKADTSYRTETVVEINAGTKRYSVTLEDGTRAKIEFGASSDIQYTQRRCMSTPSARSLEMKPLEVAQIVNNAIKTIGITDGSAAGTSGQINLDAYSKSQSSEESSFTKGEDIIYTDTRYKQERSGKIFVIETNRSTNLILDNCAPITIKFREL